jgi:acyl-CoA thioesterase YciA
MNHTLPSNKTPVMRVIPLPADTNAHGNIFGGWIFSQVDLACGQVAATRARGRVVTVAVNSFVFEEPVFVGDLLSIYVEIIKEGTTSLTLRAEVYAERNPSQVETVKVTEATLTFVAIDENRRPRPLPGK